MRIRRSTLGTIVAAALTTGVTADAASAIPRCGTAERPLRIAIDIGHSPKRFGATSAHGLREYDFNRRFAIELALLARATPNVAPQLIAKPNETISLRSRAARANTSGADVFVSIHHDSAQRHLLTSWMHRGRRLLRTDVIHGFSLFVSRQNPTFGRSRVIASAIGKAWLAAGHTPTLHHAEPIKGENRELLDKRLGVYEAPFAVLRRTRLPAVLVEVGVLANPAEEQRLQGASFRRQLQSALLAALRRSVCGARPAPEPSTAPIPVRVPVPVPVPARKPSLAPSPVKQQ